MPAKKKSKRRSAPRKSSKQNKWQKVIASSARALRRKGITTADKIELLEKRAVAYKALGALKEYSADLEQVAALRRIQLDESAQAYKQARAERQILTGIAQALVDQADLNRIGEIVGKKIQEFFDAEIAGIGLYDSEAGTIHVPYYYEKGKLKEVPPFKYGEGVASHVLKTRKPLYIPTAKEAEKYNVIYTAELPAETMLMTPILSGKKALGILSIQHSQQYAYGKHELELLSAIANGMAVAIENARLFAETNRRNAELALITSIQSALADELDIQAIYDKVGEKLREIFKVGAITINVYDLKADTNSYVYAFEDGKRKPNITLPIKAHHRFVLEQGDYFLLNIGAEQFFESFQAKAPQGTLPKSFLLVRLPQKGNQITAVTLLDIDHENAFTQADVRLLRMLAGSMGVALENARLFNEIQKSHREVSEALDQQTATSDILRTLASSPTDAKPVLTAVAQQAARLCDADDVQIYRVDGDQLRQVTHFGPLPALKDGEGLPLVPGLVVGKVVLERKAMHLEDATKLSPKEFPESVKLQRRLGHRTTVGVPLLLEGKAIGAIVVRRNVVRPFTEKQIFLLKTFADQAAIAIEKARLLNETNRLLEETTQRSAELAVINSVQEGLSRSLNLQEIIDLVGEKVGEIFHADTVFAGLYDEERDWGSHIYYVDGGRRVPVADGPIIRPSLAAHVADTKKPLLLGTKEEGVKLGTVRVVRRKTEEDRNESVLGVPILKGKSVIGGISVQSYKRNAYSKDDLRLLQTLAGSMSVALQNAQLFDETTQRNAELAVINSVQEAMAKQLDIKVIYEAVGEKIKDIFNAQALILGGFDHEAEKVIPYYFYEKGDRYFPEPWAFSGLIKELIAKQQTIVINEQFDEKVKEYGMVSAAGSETTKSGIFVPLVTGGKVVGGITLQNIDRENAFSESAVRLLETLANSMSVALENARLFDETAQRNAELAVINSVQEGLASKLDFQEIIDLVGEKVGEIFKADTVVAVMYDAQRDWGVNSYYVDRGRRVPIPDSPLPRPSLTALVVDTRQPLLIATTEESEKLGAIKRPPTESEEDLNESILYVPIMAGDKAIGAMSVQSYKQNAYDQADLRLLQTLAGNMSVALENARLFGETAQRNAELAVINSVQQGLATKLDFGEIIDLVGEKVGEIFQADTVSVGMYDVQRDWITNIYYIDRGRRVLLPDGPVQRPSLASHVGDTQQPLLLGTKEETEQWGAQRIARSENEEDKNESYLGVPILAGGKSIGVISVQSYQTNAFNQNDLHLLQTLANSMSVALENARLFDETAQRNAELAIINSVQEGIASKLDVHAIYELVGEKLRKVFPNADVTVGRYDATTDMATGEYMVEHGVRLPVGSFKVDGIGFIGELVRRPHTQVVNEKMEEAMKEQGSVLVPGTSMPRSFVNVPLVIGGFLQGVLQLQDMNKEHAFSESDVRLLETIASSVSVALENARLFDETAQRNAELAVINSVQEGIAKQTDIQGIYEVVGEKIKDIFNAQSLILGAFDHEAGRSIIYYLYEKGKRFNPEPFAFTGLIKHLIATRQTVLINEDMNSKIAEFGMIIHEGTQPAKSGIWVPLVVAGSKAIGFMSLQNVDQENAFSDSDVRLLETLANGMSVALENARLFDETAQRNAELSIINAVQEGLASKLEIRSIIDLVGDKLGEIFPDMDVVQINLYERESDLVHIPYCRENGARHEHESRQLWGIRKLVVSSRQPVVNNGPQDDSKLAEMFRTYGLGENENPVMAGEPPKSVAFVPLMVGDQVRGIISLQSITRENAFADSTVQLLTTLANSMSVALENARLFDETERLLEESRKKEEELSTVNTVSQAVASELELASLIELIGVQVRKIFKADIAYLALYDEEKDLIEFPYLFGDDLPPLKMGEGIVSRVIQEGKPLLINRDQAWQEQKVERVGTKSLSYLGVPILVGKRSIGAISVQSTQKAGRFDEADQHLLSTIAANVGAAIENARLFAEVARQKEYFETFFQYSPAAVVVVDFNGTVISWNPAAQTLFGYTAEEAIGHDVDSLVASDPRVEAEARMYTKKFTGELGRVEVKGQRTRKDGSLVDVEVKGLPIAVEGKMVGLLVIYHDISEIEQARRAAEEANQAKSAFLANMSHELRTPLNAIIGFTRIVRRKGEEALPGKQLENLDKVLVSAEHLLGLINTILDIAKIEAGRMELQLSSFNLPALVEGALTTTQPLAKPGVQLFSSLPPELSQMNSDEEKIRQVLLNLLSNAAKFTHEGSITVKGELKGAMISLAVQDTGIGIAPENLAKIFEEFQQADNTTTREYGGTGLGLSISRGLAKLLGGDLTVASVEGQGSTFTLTLPMILGVAASTNDGKGEAAEPTLDPNKPIVLVIDDQPDMFHILQQNLGDAGYQVVGALSGEEGIEKARSLHPFAITLDIMMPRKDGWQVLYELKNDPLTKDIPVIILTIVDNKPMGFRLGASDYLVKPLSEKSVLEALERLARSNGGVHPRKLLVVDDDPKVVDMVQQMLEGEDFIIENAADGLEALAHLDASQPDAILLDLLMPRMDGFQLIDALHRRPPLAAIPIIVLTAKSLTSEEQLQLEKSVVAIVQKQGLGSDTLIEKIRQTVPGPRSLA